MEEVLVTGKLYGLRDTARRIKVTEWTLYKWHETGELIPHTISPKGKRYYSEEQINAIILPRITRDDVDIDHLLTVGQFGKAIDRVNGTLREWHRNGKLIPAYISPSGNRYYTKKQVEEVKNKRREGALLGHTANRIKMKKADWEAAERKQAEENGRGEEKVAKEEKKYAYRIGEFSEVTGIEKRLLKNWARSGLLIPLMRPRKGHRYYLESQIDRAWDLHEEYLAMVEENRELEEVR